MNNWYPIKGWEGLYEINKNGEVRNAKNKNTIVGDINNCGYYRVSLYNQGQRKRYFRHRLVAEQFLDKLEGKDFVNHIDGDKSNNSLENLEWVSQSENEKHAFENGLKQKTNKPFIIEFVNGDIKEYENQYVCAKEIGCSQSSVKNWLNGQRNPRPSYGIKKIYFIV